MTIFETERLKVRQFQPVDADHFFALNGDAEVVRYIRAAKTREECDNFLQQVMQAYTDQPLYGRWAAEDIKTAEFVGSFALIPVEGKDQMQIGYSLLPAHWGKGYATELSRAGLRYVYTKTSIDPIYAYAEKENLASLQVLTKVGMHLMNESMDKGKILVGFQLSRLELGRLYMG